MINWRVRRGGISCVDCDKDASIAISCSAGIVASLGGGGLLRNARCLKLIRIEGSWSNKIFAGADIQSSFGGKSGHLVGLWGALPTGGVSVMERRVDRGGDPGRCSSASTTSVTGSSHSPWGRSSLRSLIDLRTLRTFFLHEWRRCVCRSCTSHLSRVKKELLDRLHITRKDQSNPKPTKKQHNKTQTECNL